MPPSPFNIMTSYFFGIKPHSDTDLEFGLENSQLLNLRWFRLFSADFFEHAHGKMEISRNSMKSEKYF